jgi:hypothetical protein
MLDSISQKEAAYKDGIKQNHAHCTTAAANISDSGNIESILMMMTKETEGKALISQEEVQAFLDEQRGRLKKLAEQNVDRDRTVDIFVSSVRQLRQRVLTESNNTDTEGNAAVATDYEEQLKLLMDAEEKRRQGSQLDVHQETYYREVSTALGEKDMYAKKPADDDIEVVQTGPNTVSLLCPVTRALFEDPVKSKVCAHVFSRVGIMHMIGNKGYCQCPVAGCNNGRITMEQLEDDVATATMVRKEKRREDAAHKARASQAANVDESDEEVF